MSVRFKFKNDLDFSAVPCDGFHISVRDLKKAIIRKKRLGRVTDFDLDVINQQDNKPFENEEALISKNSTLIIVRRPLPAGTQKVWEDDKGSSASAGSRIDGGGLQAASGFLTSTTGNSVELSEEDRINEAINNSTELYGQKHWIKYRGKAGGGRPPVSYRCTKCHQAGHWKEDCLLTKVRFSRWGTEEDNGDSKKFSETCP